MSAGYFTSRPALKGYVREMNSFLQVCKQVEVIGVPLMSLRQTKASSNKLRKCTLYFNTIDTQCHHVDFVPSMRLKSGCASAAVWCTAKLHVAAKLHCKLFFFHFRGGYGGDPAS